MDSSGEKAQADYVFTLVHGTWGRNSSWCRDDSELCKQLRVTFGQTTILNRFPWTGRNSLIDRREAATQLSDEILELHKSNPKARHFVIAHSHGGNIAFQALRRSKIQQHISGLICISTPFLYPQLRNLQPFTLKGRWLAASGYLSFMYVIFNQLGLLVALLSIPLFPALKRSITSFILRLRRQTTLPSVKCPVLVVRSPGDEALAGLKAARIIGWAATLYFFIFNIPWVLGQKLNWNIWRGKWTITGAVIVVILLYALQPILFLCNDTAGYSFWRAPPMVHYTNGMGWQGFPLELWTSTDSEEIQAQAAAEPFDKKHQATGPTIVICNHDELLDSGMLGMLLFMPILLPFFLMISFSQIVLMLALGLLVLIPVAISTVGIRSSYAYFLLDVSPRMYPPSHYDEIVLPRKFKRFWVLAHSQGYQDPASIESMMKWLRSISGIGSIQSN